MNHSTMRPTGRGLPRECAACGKQVQHDERSPDGTARHPLAKWVPVRHFAYPLNHDLSDDENTCAGAR